MTTPFILGQTVSDFDKQSDTYLFALRRSEDGDLYLLKANLNDEREIVELFGKEMPSAFNSFNIPGTDYYDGRNADKTLEYPIENVKYEQWKWLNGKHSYYIDDDGNFILVTGKNVELSPIDDIRIPNGHAQSFTIVGQNYNINLYDELIKMGWNGLSEVNLTINGTVGSTHPLKPAILIDRQFKNGLNITNNATISGCNGNLQHDPIENRYNGVTIVIETSVSTFTNNGALIAGSFNNNYANVFRGFSRIASFSSTGSWTGYDD